MGQFNADEWRGKLHSIDTLEFLGNQDYKDFHGISFNSNLSKYGGWKNGPKQEAKGFFYTKKFDGKWWFVDPDGYLFWSLGITGIGGGSATKTTSREVLFSDLSLDRFSVKKYQDSMTLAASNRNKQAARQNKFLLSKLKTKIWGKLDTETPRCNSRPLKKLGSKHLRCMVKKIRFY